MGKFGSYTSGRCSLGRAILRPYPRSRPEQGKLYKGGKLSYATAAAEQRLRNVTRSVAQACPAMASTQIGDVALLDREWCGSAAATAAPVAIHLLPPLRRSEGGRLSTGRKGRHCDPRGDQTKRNVSHDLPHFA
jgi:hypothetical protein